MPFNYYYFLNMKNHYYYTHALAFKVDYLLFKRPYQGDGITGEVARVERVVDPTLSDRGGFGGGIDVGWTSLESRLCHYRSPRQAAMGEMIGTDTVEYMIEDILTLEVDCTNVEWKSGP